MTNDGIYKLVNSSFYLDRNEWYRITMVYDPASTSGDYSGNKIYNDNEMYSIPRIVTRQHRPGIGQIVLGREYTDDNVMYTNVMIDDLKMWNRMLSHEEIINMTE